MAGNVLFSGDDWRLLEEYTDVCPVEVACMGYAKLDGDTVVVDEVFLVPQVISLSSVEFLSKGLPWAVNKAMEEDRVNELRFCWHSHATHDAYFSQTDKNMVEKVRKAAPALPWFCSVVLNKKGKTHAQLDWFRPDGELKDFTNHITIPLDVLVEGDRIDLAEQRMEEIAEFAEKKSDYDKKYRNKTKTKPKDSILPLEQTSTDTEWTETITTRDRFLHKLAKKNGWECYIKDDVAYYWHAETREFKGSAPIPIDPKTGDWTIDVEQTVIDASDPGSMEEELVPIDDAEEELLEQAMKAGML